MAIGIVSIIIVNNITEMIIYFVFPDLRSSFESVYIYKKKRINKKINKKIKKYFTVMI